MKTLKTERLEALRLPTQAKRHDAYLAIDPDGRPDAKIVRDYQKKIKRHRQTMIDLRASITVEIDVNRQAAMHRYWRPRVARWTQWQRWEKRARATGDKQRAQDLATSYHQNVGALYKSQYASIGYGQGGQADSDSTIYKGRYKGWAAKWHNAGVYVDYSGRRPVVAVENSTGKRVADLPLPPKSANYIGLLDGDLWATPTRERIGDARVYLRHGLRHEKIVSTGYAVWIESNEKNYKGENFGAWEHAKTIVELSEEIEHKIAIAAEKATAEKQSARIERKIRLVARLCRRLRVEVRHARACGYCVAGIDAFRSRHGIEGEAVEAGILRRIADERIEAPILQAARELVLA